MPASRPLADSVLVVERFDRRIAPNGQVANASATGRLLPGQGCLPFRKYENDGGQAQGVVWHLRQSVNAEADMKTLDDGSGVVLVAASTRWPCQEFQYPVSATAAFPADPKNDGLSVYPVSRANA